MPDDQGEGSEGNVLVLGGCGFIGRNLVVHLVSSDQLKRVVVVDKSIPALSNFGHDYAAAFKDARVKFIQGDVSRAKTVERVFGECKYDIVFNAAAETRLSLPEVQYEAKVLNLAKINGEAAAKNGVRRFVHFSTCRVYGGSKAKKPHDETTPRNNMKPWTMQASYSLKAEDALREIDGLDVVILRPANVYGPGDVTTNGIMGRAVVGAVYFQLNEKMKVLWSKDLKVNTVHVEDVCRAARCVAYAPKEAISGSTFNLVDESNTNQGVINKYLSSMFGIRTSCIGQLASNIARIALKTVTNAANDHHMAPWNELCNHHGVKHSPLSPFVDPELLKCNHLYASGRTICENLNFQYTHPDFTEKLFRGMVRSAVDAGAFPPILHNDGGNGAGSSS